MGFRHRSTIRLGRGLRINLSKSGASLSVGRRGATMDLCKRGGRTTVGVPGSGLSYSKAIPRHARDGHRGGLPPAEPAPSRSGVSPAIILVLIAIGAVLWVFGRS